MNLVAGHTDQVPPPAGPYSQSVREDTVVSMRVHLTEVSDFAGVNEVYPTLFSEPYPARATVYVGLPPGQLAEIDALAVLDA